MNVSPEANISLVIAPYPAELDHYSRQFGRQILSVHQPHFVDTEIHLADLINHRNERREFDVLLAGCLEPAHWYPLRVFTPHYNTGQSLTILVMQNRLANLLGQDHLWDGLKIKHRKHPGYPDLLWHDKTR